MGDNSHTVGIIHKRVARRACFVLICSAKSAVNHNQLAVSLYRTFALFADNGNMTVDYVTVIFRKTEFLQNLHAGIFIVIERVVMVACFRVGFGIVNKETLKRTHFFSAEKR